MNCMYKVSLKTEDLARMTMLLFVLIVCLGSTTSNHLPRLFSEDDLSRSVGLVHPPDCANNRANDPETLLYLQAMRELEIPDSFDARDKGWISEPKHQKSCGSCIVFTNVALIETCIAKVRCTSEPDNCRVPDLSEQEALECAFDPPKANGCLGAYPEAYVDWIIKRGGYMAEELALPYDPRHLTHSCPTPPVPDDIAGVKITEMNKANEIDEETLKALVYHHGAVQTSIAAHDDSFKHYDGGIYEGCTTKNTNHGVVLVGYGTEDGVDYWIAKNNWGKHWGESGFMRFRRGVGECGVGEMILTVECKHMDGPTSAPMTTTTTVPSIKADCDMTEHFHGYPLTTNGITLSVMVKGVHYSTKVDCNAGRCAPEDMTGVVNACSVICGEDPCKPPTMRSLSDLLVNGLPLQQFLETL